MFCLFFTNIVGFERIRMSRRTHWLVYFFAGVGLIEKLGIYFLGICQKNTATTTTTTTKHDLRPSHLMFLIEIADFLRHFYSVVQGRTEQCTGHQTEDDGLHEGWVDSTRELRPVCLGAAATRGTSDYGWICKMYRWEELCTGMPEDVSPPASAAPAQLQKDSALVAPLRKDAASRCATAICSATSSNLKRCLG